MKLMGAVRALRHCFEQLLRRVLGVAGHEADEIIAGYFIYLAYKVGKIRVRAEVAPVGVDVLPQERDVLIPRLYKRPRLGDNILRLS